MLHISQRGVLMQPRAEAKSLILILDDNPDMCRLLDSILSDNDFETMTFTDPHQALQALQRTRPAVVISDIAMPEMDGVSFRQHLLKDDRLRTVPFVFLTGKNGLDQKIEGLKAGIDGYITKPFLPTELIATVKNAVRRAADYQSTLVVDPLTHSYNRLYLQQQLPELVEKLRREKIPAACAMIDIDRFKEINDRFGHQTGDLVLTAVAEIIRKNIRQDDVLVRYGGEEFLLFLPYQKSVIALMVVERIRKVISAQVFTDAEGERQFQVTISCGLCDVSAERSLDEVIGEADRRLYDAKEHGRDRTTAVPAG